MAFELKLPSPQERLHASTARWQAESLIFSNVSDEQNLRRLDEVTRGGMSVPAFVDDHKLFITWVGTDGHHSLNVIKVVV